MRVPRLVRWPRKNPTTQKRERSSRVDDRQPARDGHVGTGLKSQHPVGRRDPRVAGPGARHEDGSPRRARQRGGVPRAAPGWLQGTHVAHGTEQVTDPGSIPGESTYREHRWKATAAKTYDRLGFRERLPRRARSKGGYEAVRGRHFSLESSGSLMSAGGGGAVWQGGQVARRWAHNPETAGSIPAPAICCSGSA